MTNLRLKAIPAALVAAGLFTVGAAYAGDQASGTPTPGVFAQGTFAPTSYAVSTRNLYAPDATSAATATGGFIFVGLKPTQTAWGYALTDSNFDNTRGTHTLTHTVTTGSNVCSVNYRVSYNMAGVMTVVYDLATSVLNGTASTATTAVSACKNAFANQTGLTAGTFGTALTTSGGGTSKSYNLIY